MIEHVHVAKWKSLVRQLQQRHQEQGSMGCTLNDKPTTGANLKAHKKIRSDVDRKENCFLGCRDSLHWPDTQQQKDKRKPKRRTRPFPPSRLSVTFVFPALARDCAVYFLLFCFVTFFVLHFSFLDPRCKTSSFVQAVPTIYFYPTVPLSGAKALSFGILSSI